MRCKVKHCIFSDSNIGRSSTEHNSDPLPDALSYQPCGQTILTIREPSHTRSNVPTAGQGSADSDRDAEVLNILQRVLNTPSAS